jgi:hypothetical protein
MIRTPFSTPLHPFRHAYRSLLCCSSRRLSTTAYMLLFPGQGAQRQAIYIMAAAFAQHELAADLFQTANDAAGCDVKTL